MEQELAEPDDQLLLDQRGGGRALPPQVPLILSCHLQSQAVTSPAHGAAALLPGDTVAVQERNPLPKKKNSGRAAEGRPIALAWELAM